MNIHELYLILQDCSPSAKIEILLKEDFAFDCTYNLHYLSTYADDVLVFVKNQDYHTIYLVKG